MKKSSFAWDDEKDRENQDKHNVSFSLAQFAFLDPHRVIAEDVTHRSKEDRFYCIGRVGDEIIMAAITCLNFVIPARPESF